MSYFSVSMHDIEPYYNWDNLYRAADDARSPFFGQEYSELYFSDSIYDHVVHPQWDHFGSATLRMKILYADYDDGYAIIELLGEWNDCIGNDIMFMKRDIVEDLMYEGITKFILIGENVLNAYCSDDSYYEEWFDEVNEEDGWICLLNFRQHVIEEFIANNIDSYFLMGGSVNDLEWRTYRPLQLFQKVEQLVEKRLGMPSME